MKNKRGPIDFPLFITILILLCIGVVMVFSSSMVMARDTYNDSFYFLKKQIIWAGLGVITMFGFSNFDYKRLKNKKFLALAMLFAITTLVVVLFTAPKKGATRWIGVGGLGFQPSETAKIILVMYLSDMISRKGENIKSFKKGVIPVLFISGVFAALILKEPNMSTAVIIMAAAFALLFVGGADMKQLLGLAAVGVAAIAFGIFSAEYRMRRFTAFLNPFADPLYSGFQAIQSLYALGSGGLFGVGFGQSRQKQYYIPEAQNDFIFAIIGEELGFIWVLFILILFAFLCYRGFKIALNTKDKFGSLLAAGITSLIAVQSSVNLMVVSSFMPTTGVTLPLVSYGGSSLLFTMGALGILLNISRYSGKNSVE